MNNSAELIDINLSRTASALDETSLWSMAFGRLMLRELALLPNTKCLDLGCGTGFPLLELAQMHDDTCHFTGIDPWQAGLARAQEKLAVYALKNVALIELSGDRLPLPDTHFDLITANLVLNNLEQPEITLAECARVAKPGARFAATTNLNGHMREFYTVFADVLREMKQDDALEHLRLSEIRRGTLASHVQSLEQAGFQVHKTVEDTLTLRYLNGNAFLRHWFIQVAFLPSWRSIVEELHRDSVFQRLETRLNSLSRENGELRLTVPMLYLEAKRL